MKLYKLNLEKKTTKFKAGKFECCMAQVWAGIAQ
jgi:hypothetical protein